jgi:hypothetical protein
MANVSSPESGQTLPEYAVTLGVITVVAAAAFVLIGSAISGLVGAAAAAI